MGDYRGMTVLVMRASGQFQAVCRKVEMKLAAESLSRVVLTWSGPAPRLPRCLRVVVVRLDCSNRGRAGRRNQLMSGCGPPELVVEYCTVLYYTPPLESTLRFDIVQLSLVYLAAQLHLQ